MLHDAKTIYQVIEKLALALVTAARHFRPYFQSYQIIVRTDHPIKQILRKMELAGKMIAWLVELSYLGIQFEPQGSMKAQFLQFLSDFVVELSSLPSTTYHSMTLCVDETSNLNGNGAGIILEGSGETSLEQTLQFDFNASNNQTE